MRRWLMTLALTACSGIGAGAQQELPAGEGREVVVGLCTQCHGLREFAPLRHSREDWQRIVADMVSRGAAASESEIGIVVDYLEKYLGTATPAGAPAGEVAIRATSVVREAYTFDRVQVMVPDVAQAVEWYVTRLGGVRGTLPDQVVFGKALIVFRARTSAPGGTGSSVDHIAISFADLSAAMKAFEGGGVKILEGVREPPGLFKLAFIEDPWGAKIEVVQDPELLGFHHVHVRAADPEAVLEWIVETFGNTRARLMERLDGVHAGAAWVLVQRAEGDVPPGSGHSIEVLGWRVGDLDSAMADLSTRGVGFAGEPHTVDGRRSVYLQTPAGMRIEIVEQRR